MNKMLSNISQIGFGIVNLGTNKVVVATVVYIMFLVVLFGLSTWGCAIYGKTRKIYSNILLWTWALFTFFFFVSSFSSYEQCFPHSTQIDRIKAGWYWMLGIAAGGVLTLVYRRKKGIKDADQIWMEGKRALAKAPLLVRTRAVHKQMWITAICSIFMVVAIPAGAVWSAWRAGANAPDALMVGMHTFRRSYEMMYIALAVIGNWIAVARYFSLRGQEHVGEMKQVRE
ncbi:MAG: hypothetical protein ACP5I8_14670 [Phycisphaerae bacterium]